MFLNDDELLAKYMKRLTGNNKKEKYALPLAKYSLCVVVVNYCRHLMELVNIALEKGLAQIVNEKIITDDYTIGINGIVIAGNRLYMKAHAIPSERSDVRQRTCTALVHLQ